MPSLKDFKVIAFDTMGTLLDEKAGIAHAAGSLVTELPSGTTQEDLYHAFARTLERLLKTETPSPSTTYAGIMTSAIALACQDLSAGTMKPTPSEAAGFAAALADWPPFADTVTSLQFLASKGHKLVLISNMDTSTLHRIADARSGSFKDVPLSELIGCDAMHVFKPHHIPPLLDAAEKNYGVGREGVLLVAQGLESDHVPATEMGVAGAWIDRYGAGRGAIPDKARPGWVFESLEELCEQYKREAEITVGSSD